MNGSRRYEYVMDEAEEAFYLFHKDEKHFVMIAKESFLS